jgi:hypothetical protein
MSGIWYRMETSSFVQALRYFRLAVVVTTGLDWSDLWRGLTRSQNFGFRKWQVIWLSELPSASQEGVWYMELINDGCLLTQSSRILFSSCAFWSRVHGSPAILGTSISFYYVRCDFVAELYPEQLLYCSYLVQRSCCGKADSR